MGAQVKAGSAYLEGRNLGDRIVVEQTAIWRDSARALGWFEECDFEEPDESAAMPIGILVVVLVLVTICVAAACYRRQVQVRSSVAGQHGPCSTKGSVNESELADLTANS